MGLAGAVASQGRLEEAAHLFEAAERTLRLRLGPEDLRRAGALYNLGILNRDLERYDRAESFHREALAIRERALGKAHPQVAASLSGLARALSGGTSMQEEVEELNERVGQLGARSAGRAPGPPSAQARAAMLAPADEP